jgi:hypothetical protein
MIDLLGEADSQQGGDAIQKIYNLSSSTIYFAILPSPPLYPFSSFFACALRR